MSAGSATPVVPDVTAPGPTAATTQQSLDERVAAVAAVTAEHAERTDRDAVFPVEALAELRRTGLLGLLVPVELGGLGGTLDELIDVSIALGRVDMSVAMIFAMHCQQAAAIERFATEPLRSRLLRRVASGDLYLASVTTEDAKGGHLLSSQSPLVGDDESLRLERFAPVCTGGNVADGFLVTMQRPNARGEHEVSLVYADRTQLEIAPAGGWDPLGMRASESIPLRLSGTVPGDQVIGEHGMFRDVATQVFAPMAHIGWSACWLGTAAGALSRVLTMLRSPQSKGRVDLSSELLLSRLATARCRVDTVHALLRHTARTVADCDDVSLPRVQLLLNALKITASEQCHAVVEDLVDTVGMRHGYLRNSPTTLERALRDLRSAALNYSNDRLRLADGKLALVDTGVRLV